ncbi:MAG TPA: 3'-5' exonuclease [candidate division Zixibacteria bacterium]|nr:3'-5' exonuclease [candidate division Zixibacteria bacterium]
MPSTPIHNAQFLAIDMEMTGVDPRVHEIVEVAAVPFTGLSMGEEEAFYSEIKPERFVPSKSKAVHGLHGRELSHAPPIQKVLPEFLNLFRGRILITHGPDVDLRFLAEKSRIVGMEPPLRPVIDTSKLGLSVFNDFTKRPSLNDLLGRFGLSRPREKHNALSDAILTARVFIGTVIQLKKAGKAATVMELLRLGGA